MMVLNDIAYLQWTGQWVVPALLDPSSIQAMTIASESAKHQFYFFMLFVLLVLKKQKLRKYRLLVKSPVLYFLCTFFLLF